MTLKQPYLFALVLFVARSAAGAPPAPYPLTITPGTPEEARLLRKNSGTTLDRSVRRFERGQFCVYGVTALPGSSCRLELTLDAPAPSDRPEILLFGVGNKPLPFRLEQNVGGVFSILWTVPSAWPIGAPIPIEISAKEGPLALQSLKLIHQERDVRNDGVPDAMTAWMRSGLPADIQPISLRPPDLPYTFIHANQAPTPEEDPLADAVLLHDAPEGALAAWSARGRSVWVDIPTSALPDFASKAADRVQTGADGKPILTPFGVAPSPLPPRVEEETKTIDAALAEGAEGVSIDDPGYWAKAGYEPAFRLAWQSRLHSPWQDPMRSLDARYRASSLMATLAAERVQGLLQETQRRKPDVRRLVALRSFLENARSGWISPIWQTDAQPAVSDLIAQLSDTELDASLRYDGVHRSLPFARAFLTFSALRNVTRDLDRRLWLSLDMGGVTADGIANAALFRTRFEQAVTAALFMDETAAYQTPSVRQAGSDADLATEINTISVALEEMHAQSHSSAMLMSDIGVLVSDTLQWQREGPYTSDPEEACSLALPLLQKGVPIQIVSLERSVDPGYLNHFRTLLLSYDAQKPMSARTQEALAAWVRRGGSLLLFGGADPYNDVTSSWWRTAGLYAPQADLWVKCGLQLSGPPQIQKPTPEDLSRYTEITPEPGRSDTRTLQVDLSRFARQSGSTAVRFTARSNTPIALRSVELLVGGRLAAAFLAGSDLENRFLAYDDHSQFSSDARTVSGSAAWTYQFDHLPQDLPSLLILQATGDLRIQAASAQPDSGRTLLSTSQAPGLADLFPRLRLGASYPATLYPLPPASFAPPAPVHPGPRGPKLSKADSGAPVALYTLRSGGAPIWMQSVDHGLIVHVGVAPSFFTAGPASGGLLRALTRLAYQRAGGVYREPGFIHLKRGRYSVVQTFNTSRFVEGRTIDLFSPTLDVAQNRAIPPHSSALLYQLEPPAARPRIDYVSGRMQAVLETETLTAFFTRGPRGTRGAARIDRSDKKPIGVRAIDRLGRPLSVEMSVEGGSIQLRYPNDPDGVAIRVGWSQ